MADIHSLTKQIISVQHYFKKFALSQINNALTFRNWVIEYPMIGQLLTAKFKTMDYSIWQLPTAKSISEPDIPTATKNTVPVELLIDKLSFTF